MSANLEQWMMALMKEASTDGGLPEQAGDRNAVLNELLQGFPDFATAVLSGERVDSLDELDGLIAGLGLETPTEGEEAVVDRLLCQQSVGALLSLMTAKLGDVQTLVEEVSTRSLSIEKMLKLQDVEVCLGHLILSVGKLRIEAGVEPLSPQRPWLTRIKAILFYKIF